MKLDSTVNAVLNDIMAGENAAVLLYAPSEYDKEDFLGELGTRYYKSYWFNAAACWKGSRNCAKGLNSYYSATRVTTVRTWR